MAPKAELSAALDAAFEDCAELVRGLSDAAFESAPPGKWTPGMQVAHLAMSTRPVTLAMRQPRTLLRVVMGRPRRESQDYDWVVAAYREALARGGKAPKGYVPREVPSERRNAAVDGFLREKTRLLAALDRWRDASLDTVQLPHPLIGKLTLREMLCFTLYHTRHHAANIREIAATQ